MPQGIYERAPRKQIEIICPCGTSRWVYPSSVGTAKYCSRECVVKYRPQGAPCQPGCKCDRHATEFKPSICVEGVCTVYTNKQGVPFQIDESDLESVLCRSWYISHDPGYPATTIKVYGHPKIKQRVFFLHNYLLGSAPDGLEWDHIDRDPLNNRRNNFRAVTHQVNCRNATGVKQSYSGVKGVAKAGNKCVAYIDDTRLGLFDTIEEALVARKDAEIRIWGDQR